MRVLYGQAWAESDAPSVLSAYCVLLFMLALNGILDAFFNARATPAAISHMRYVAGCSSVVLVLISYLGRTPATLVWANTAATALRVVACILFASDNLSLNLQDLGLATLARLFGSVAVAGGVSHLLLPYIMYTYSGPIPWVSVIGSCLGAGMSILLIGFICKEDIAKEIRMIRSSR